MSPSSLESILQKAVGLHRQGQNARAEKLYRKALKIDPHSPDALHFLGMLLFQKGQADKGREMILAAIALKPDYTDACLNLGNIFLSEENFADARRCYEKARSLSPERVEVLNNFALLLRHQGDYGQSVQLLDEVIQRLPGWAEAHFNLANSLMFVNRSEDAMDRLERALEIKPELHEAVQLLVFLAYTRGDTARAHTAMDAWRAADPDHPAIDHVESALTGVDPPDRASDRYIRSTFDGYAAGFEASLARLDYRGPETLGRVMRDCHGEGADDLTILDAGCGTGLGLVHLAPYARRLIGMDLSEGMLAQARAKQGYDQLVCASLETGIAQYDDYFDVIACIDTMIYFGRLDELLNVMRGALKPGGRLVFTLERLDDREGWRLEPHGRYAHSRAELERAMNATGLVLESLTPDVLRMELGKTVNGWVGIARRAMSPAPEPAVTGRSE